MKFLLSYRWGLISSQEWALRKLGLMILADYCHEYFESRVWA